jgi:hypothetical protein
MPRRPAEPRKVEALAREIALPPADQEIAHALRVAEAVLADVDESAREAIAARLKAHGDGMPQACEAEHAALVRARAVLTPDGWVVTAPPLTELARVYAVAAQLAAPATVCIRLAEHAFKLAQTERVIERVRLSTIEAERKRTAREIAAAARKARAAERQEEKRRRSEAARQSALQRPPKVGDDLLVSLANEYREKEGNKLGRNTWIEARLLGRHNVCLQAKQIAIRLKKVGR